MATHWLYNSDGDPIAFIQGDNVFSSKGNFVGKLYPDETVWNGDYIGQLFADDRLIFDATKLFGNRKMPGLPGLPGFVGEAPFKGAITIPSGYRDVDLHLIG